MDRPDYLSHDDDFQGVVKAARSKFCTPTATPRKYPALLLSVLSMARVGTFQMTELQNGPSRSRCRTGSPKLLRLTLLCSQKRSRPGSLILPSECNASDFVAIPAMVALGAVIGRKTGIRPQRADALDYGCEFVGLHHRAARHEIFTPRVTSAGSRNRNGAPACQFILRACQGTRHLANDLLEEVTKGNAKRRQTINREGPRGLPRGHDHEFGPAERSVSVRTFCKSPIRSLRVRRAGGGITSFKGKVMSANLNSRQEKFAQDLAKGMSKAKAYVEAGYKSDPVNPTRMTENDRVQKRVAEPQKRAAIDTGVTIQAITADLTDLIKEASVLFSIADRIVARRKANRAMDS